MSLLPLTSCSHKDVKTITLKEWIHEINEKAGIDSYQVSSPYFLNVQESDSCFLDVQAAVEWNILDPSLGFEPDKKLTNEWAAYTLMNLANKNAEESLNIQDISDSKFQSQIQTAVSSGLMHIDSQNMFHPNKVIEKEVALKLLYKIIFYINNREINETKTNIVWNDETPIEVTPIAFNQDKLTVQVSEGVTYVTSDILHWNDGINDYYYEVESQDENNVQLKEINLLEKTKSVDLSGSSELDFSNATIMDADNNTIQETSYSNKLENMSLKAIQKSFNLNDFKIMITTSNHSVKAEVSREMKYGSKAYASVKLNGLKCDYQWNSKDDSLNTAYFKVKFHSEEDIGLKNGSYKNLYGDFSTFSADDFMNSLTTMFKEKKDVLESTLTLCQLKVPLPNAPMMNVTIALELHMYVSGKVELVLQQDSEVGFEVKKGNMRIIKDMSHSENNQIKATTEARSGIVVGVNLVSLRLMDLALNTSAKASLKTQLHLYDNAEHRILETDVSSDIASELSDNNKNVLVCCDINANLSMYLKLNSLDSQLGKFGFTKRFDILKISLLPSTKTHLENFQFVSKCTRKDRLVLKDAETITVSKKIKLQDYSIIVRLNKERQIIITGLPDGYKKEDLVYSSDNESVASVNSEGVVSGISGGAAVITVSTNDDAHYIKCNVLVPEISS